MTQVALIQNKTFGKLLLFGYRISNWPPILTNTERIGTRIQTRDFKTSTRDYNLGEKSKTGGAYFKYKTV